MSLPKTASDILEKLSHLFEGSKQAEPFIDQNDIEDNLNELAALNQHFQDNEALQYSDVLNYVNFMNDNTTSDASSHDVLIEFGSPVDQSAPTTPVASFTSDPLEPFDQGKSNDSQGI